MIAWYRTAGPRMGLPDKWMANTGILEEDFIRLAEAEGMKSFTDPPQFDPFTSSQLEGFLSRYGPIWCAGVWDGPKHIIVLTGVEEETLYFNDPNGGYARRESLAWFNRKLSRIRNCMMYMPAGGGR